MLDESTPVSVIPGELLDDIGAHVAVLLLDLLGCPKRGVWLPTVSEKRLHEVGDVSSSNRDRLDRGPDDVSFRDGDDMGHTITRIDDGSCEGPVVDLGRGPRSRQGKNGLDGDI